MTQRDLPKKTSFDPVSNQDTCILILGSLPGDKSIELSEYYGHARNRFWKIISAITGQELPSTYTEKTALLFSVKVVSTGQKQKRFTISILIERSR